MPRKNTIQPLPLQTGILEDGTVWEVRDETCLEIGRGLHNRNKYEQKRDEVLERVANDYLSRNGRKFVPSDRDYMQSASRFVEQCEIWGVVPEEIEDISSFRKKLYSDIKKQIQALENALSVKHSG